MMVQVRLSAPWVSYVSRCADAISIVFSGWLAIYLREGWSSEAEFSYDLTSYYALISVGAIAFAAFPGRGYQSWRGANILGMFAGIGVRWFVLIGLLLFWMFVFKASQDFSRVWFFLWGLLGLAILVFERLLIHLILWALRHNGLNLRKVALIGTGETAENLRVKLSHAAWSGYAEVLSLPQPDPAALKVLEAAEIDEVWLALPLREVDEIRKVLHALRHSTAAIRFAPDMFTLRLINHGVSDVLGVPMFDLSTSPMTGLNQLVKWLEDKTLSALILVAISPLMILLALGVKLTSPGPVFYRQERVGLNSRPFFMLKFRSMPVDTEATCVQWGGSAAKATTRFGQFIRRTSLDELPQFFNVLKGDMSIVGPRPERPMFVEQFKEEIPDYMKKHLVKAGITGWAQVHGWRGDTDLKIRIEYDIYYIDNWSLWLDLKIILMTVFKGFVNKNAY